MFPKCALGKMEGVENKGDEVMNKITDHLQPGIYKEKSYIISKGEPIDFFLLITQGVVWCFGSTSDQIEHRTRHYYHGKELLD